MLELAVLGLLKRAPMSGYELKKQLTVKLGAFWRVSYGSLYPCLKRLAADGALDVEVSPFTSRKKHVYRLTDQGNRLFHQLLESADGHGLEQDRFSMRLAFFRYLRPEAAYQLERRRGYLQERLADLRASVRTARERMDAYTIELMDHGLDEREREIAWLDRLIARERRRDRGAVEQDPAEPPAQLPHPRATPCPHRPGRPRRPGDQTQMGKLRRGRRRGQLRVVAGAGCALLRRRRAGRPRPRSDAR